jgi:predicted Rossmann fold flavoprotein
MSDQSAQAPVSSRVANADVIVIGAGAAGMMAAAFAAQRGQRVMLLEKNSKVGVKILMSGGTRCNLTQDTDARGIIKAFGHQGAFLRAALAPFGPHDVVQLFAQLGVPTKTEATGKIFPVSDRALDVQRALLEFVRQSGATLVTNSAVEEIGRLNDGTFRVQCAADAWMAPRIIVTTGGQSYPGCGTRGDGYAWMQHLGHTIVAPRPALVPVLVRADWAKALSGITVPDVVVHLEDSAPSSRDQASPAGQKQAKRTATACRGSLLFAHFGLTGPAILDVSHHISRHPQPRQLTLFCDFLPDRNAEQLQQLFVTQAQSDGKKRLSQLASEWLPRRLIEALLSQCQISEDQRLAELPRAARQAFIQHLKATPFPVSGTLGFEKAEVTAGGVALDEVDAKSMHSKLVPGLYLAGELLDLDGPIGGYNFQAAFSTGRLAGLATPPGGP